MQKDLKIGLAVGLGLVAAAVVWVSTRPSMSPEARMGQLHNTDPVEQAGPAEEPNEQPVVSVIARSPEPNLPLPTLPEAPPPETPIEETVVPAEEEEPGVFDSTVHEQTVKIETQRFHIVRKGETLSKISLTYYGSAGQWRKIFEANRLTIEDPDKLTLGQKLIIPD
ncbi:MAG: LysM peptidoglycan-binding domain-containing protein [Phycisphaerales bacterium]|nr:MAG: LysM peptidoglycan-binding domain-containing protein [Phycisphaerales bacterium]